MAFLASGLVSPRAHKNRGAVAECLAYKLASHGAYLSPWVPTFFPSTSTFTMKGQYPEIQGGGSLILAWQVKNKNVLVIGGGDVSEIQSRSRV